MASYYVNENPQPNGEHEVHKEGCDYLKLVVNKKYLGDFNNCLDAVRKAREIYDKVDGCFYCSYECHFRLNILVP